jgi:uncharacterized membrane protein (DUF485 family)
MFTALELQYINAAFKYCSLFPTSPFRFKDGELQADERRFTVSFQRAKLLLLVLSFVVLASKFPSTLSSRCFPHIVVNGIEIMIPFGLFQIQLTIYLYQDEILALVKQSLAFNQSFGK